MEGGLESVNQCTDWVAGRLHLLVDEQHQIVHLLIAHQDGLPCLNRHLVAALSDLF